MATKRFQNKVAESRYALLTTALLTLPAWLGAGILNGERLPQFVLTALAAYVMIELNNRNALIRIYSRMVSCAFLVMCAMMCASQSTVESCAVGLCLALSYLLLFHTYQDRQAQGLVFYAFLCLGVASMMFVQVLYFVPLTWIVMGVNLMMMSPRNLAASLLGLLCPYWFAAAYFLYQGDIATPLSHITSLWDYTIPFQLQGIDTHQAATAAAVVIMALTGTVHFLRTSYNDKIRTRMLYEIFITMDTACLVMLVLQPQHFAPLMAMMTVNTAPLIGHYIALTRTRVTDVSFKLLIAASATVTVYNTWIQ